MESVLNSSPFPSKKMKHENSPNNVEMKLELLSPILAENTRQKSLFNSLVSDNCLGDQSQKKFHEEYNGNVSVLSTDYSLLSENLSQDETSRTKSKNRKTRRVFESEETQVEPTKKDIANINLDLENATSDTSFSMKKSKKKHKNTKQEMSSPKRNLNCDQSDSLPTKKKKKSGNCDNENIILSDPHIENQSTHQAAENNPQKSKKHKKQKFHIDEDETAKTKKEKPKECKLVDLDSSQERLSDCSVSKKKRAKPNWDLSAADSSKNKWDEFFDLHKDEQNVSHRKKEGKSHDKTDCRDIISSHSTDENASEIEKSLKKKKHKKHKLQDDPGDENEFGEAREKRKKTKKFLSKSTEDLDSNDGVNKNRDKIDSSAHKKKGKSDGGSDDGNENCSVKKKKRKKQTTTATNSEGQSVNKKKKQKIISSDQLPPTDFVKIDTSTSFDEDAISDQDDKSIDSNKVPKKERKLLPLNKFKKVFSEVEYERTIIVAKQPRDRKFSAKLTSQDGILEENMAPPKLAPFEEDPDKDMDHHLEGINEEKQLNDEKFGILVPSEIIVPWEIPPLHLIESQIVGRLSEAQKNEIEATNIKVKTGNFSKEEDRQLNENWERFCKVYRLPRDPTPFLSFENKKRTYFNRRLNFVRFLAHGLENRLLASVYRRFRTLNISKDVKTGKFTEKEDQIIIDYIKTSKSKKPYADLAALLKRTRGSIEKRCLKLTSFKDSSEVKWDRDRTENFLKNLVEITKVKDVSELKNRKMTDKEWKQMGERLGILPDKVKRGWLYTIYPRIFVTKATYTKDVKRNLINYLIEKGVKDWRVINWNDVAENFEGMTPRVLNKLLKDLVGYHVPGNIHDNLGECLDYIQKEILPFGLIRGKKIRRLKVVDNRKNKDDEIVTN